MKYVHDNPEFWEFMTYGHASEEFFFRQYLQTMIFLKNKFLTKIIDT